MARERKTYEQAARECHGDRDRFYFRNLLHKARASSFWEFGWPNADSKGPPEAVLNRLSLGDVERLAAEEGELFPA